MRWVVNNCDGNEPWGKSDLNVGKCSRSIGAGKGEGSLSPPSLHDGCYARPQDTVSLVSFREEAAVWGALKGQGGGRRGGAEACSAVPGRQVGGPWAPPPCTLVSELQLQAKGQATADVDALRRQLKDAVVAPWHSSCKLNVRDVATG